jgi:acyl-CoA synthetase (AMP-forming)/AMP-acid ligase II
MSHVANDLLRRAEHAPDATLIVQEDGRAASYGEVARQARAVAARLGEYGVETGDRVLLMLPNGVDYLAVYYGSLLRGAVVVAVQTSPTAIGGGGGHRVGPSRRLHRPQMV